MLLALFAIISTSPFRIRPLRTGNSLWSTFLRIRKSLPILIFVTKCTTCNILCCSISVPRLHFRLVYYSNYAMLLWNWIHNILLLKTGPISSSFVNRWGCQRVTVAGALLASACVILSSFANNVLTLIFTIGIGAGFGFGLIYLPAIVSVTVWFERYRSLATGRYGFWCFTTFF